LAVSLGATNALGISRKFPLVHIASIETADGSNSLLQTAAFKSFVAGIKDRCEEPPVVTDLTAISSYRLFS
jgi:hypothetical protein